MQAICVLVFILYWSWCDRMRLETPWRGVRSSPKESETYQFSLAYFRKHLARSAPMKVDTQKGPFTFRISPCVTG